jgi:fermentation-respiration switch protein FrsA (DUF1100 family)
MADTNPQEITFTSNGLECKGDLYLPQGIEDGEPRPGIVMGHGFTLVKEMLAGQAEAFQASGYVVLAIDYRFFGRSAGEPRGQLLPFSQVEDYRNAVSYIQTRPEVDPERIGTWGTSFSGGLSAYVAAVDWRIKAAVSQVPVTDGHIWMKLLRSEDQWDELLRELDADRERRFQGHESKRIPVTDLSGQFCGLPSDQEIVDFFGAARTSFGTWDDTMTLGCIEEILQFSPLSVIQRITPRPILIIGTDGRDVSHPARTVAELYEHAREPKQLAFEPFGQVGLYTEPGLTIANNEALHFYNETLAPTRERRQAVS